MVFRPETPEPFVLTVVTRSSNICFQLIWLNKWHKQPEQEREKEPERGEGGCKAKQEFGAGAAGAAGRADSASLAGSITQIALSEESMEEGIEWNSALTAAVTMATEEGVKKETDEISGKLRLLLGSFLHPSSPVTFWRLKC